MTSGLEVVEQVADELRNRLDTRIQGLSYSSQSRLSDVLLELRLALGFFEKEPSKLMAIFLENRRFLARCDYLWTHRFRRALERHFQLRATLGDGQRRLPLDLAWCSWEQLLHKARRDCFEHSRADWEAIEITLEPRF